MKAELVPENGDPPIPITRDVTVIGRREFCDVRINHPSLSKRHAVIVKTDGLLVIRDLATTNGTKVKGQRIRWAALLPDDRITLGGYKLRVYLGPDEQMSPSERLASRSPALAAPPQTQIASASTSGAGFPPPSPGAGIPTVGSVLDDDLEILDDVPGNGDGRGTGTGSETGTGTGSEWRHLIAAQPRAEANGDEELIIELD